MCVRARDSYYTVLANYFKWGFAFFVKKANQFRLRTKSAVCYTNDARNLSKKEKLIGIIGCREKSVYTKLIGDDDIMKEIEKKVKDYSEDDEIVGLYDREAYEKELAEIEKEEAMKKAREKGLKQGLQEGIEQRIQKGINQGKKEIAKTMLEKKMDINVISEIVGLTVAELKNL